MMPTQVALKPIPSAPCVRRWIVRPPARPATAKTPTQPLQQLAALATTTLLTLSLTLPALAGGSNASLVSEFKSSGLLFKDTIQVFQLKDPEVAGVTIYFTDYSRSISEKLTSKEDAFSDPSQSSITCAVNGKATFTAGDASNVVAKDGKEIFAELKALNILQNKQTRIRRVYNPESGDVVYVSYNTRNTRSADEGGVSSSRYRTSVCAVHVDN